MQQLKNSFSLYALKLLFSLTRFFTFTNVFFTRLQSPQRALGGLKEVAEAMSFNTCRRVLSNYAGTETGF